MKTAGVIWYKTSATPPPSGVSILLRIWDAIRYARGQSRWNFPFQIGSEPSPKIELVVPPFEANEGEKDG